jgi:hypothetical protein
LKNAGRKFHKESKEKKPMKIRFKIRIHNFRCWPPYFLEMLSAIQNLLVYYIKKSLLGTKRKIIIKCVFGILGPPVSDVDSRSERTINLVEDHPINIPTKLNFN